MSDPSKNPNSQDANFISKILDSTSKLINAISKAIEDTKGIPPLLLKFCSVIMLLLFILLLVFIFIFRGHNDLKPVHVVFAFVFCSFFLGGAIFPLLILKKYPGEDTGSGRKPPKTNLYNGTVVGREPLHEIMESAKQSLFISGHTLRKFTKGKETERDEVKDALNSLWGKHVDVTMVFLHPKSPYAEAQQPFHPEESVEVQEGEKYIDQIMSAIEYCEDKGKEQKHFSVYLSYYKPPFRTIIIDHPGFCFNGKPSTNDVEPKCYVDLYMYGVDVDKTPRICFPKESKGYEAIVLSIDNLRFSCHVVPLIEEGETNEDWKGCGLFHILQACVERNCHESCQRCDLLSIALLGNQNRNDHHPEIYSRDYQAGTFTLNQFEDHKHLLVKKVHINFYKWLEEAVLIEFNALREKSIEKSKYLLERYRENLFEKYSEDDIVEKVRATFEIRPGTFDLSEHIWCQEYSDVIRRIILTYVLGDPDFEIDLCPDLTSESKDLALQVIKHFCITHASDISRDRLQKWLDFSVIAGLLGLDGKPDRTATSLINHEIGIKLKEVKKGEDSFEKAVYRIAKELSEIQANKSSLKSGEDMIDDSSKFFEILHQKRNLTLVSFPDDYLETLFLLKYYDFLLKEYTSLVIHIIPRSVRCGNDVIASDIYGILENSGDLFENLISSNRFSVVEKGPKIGGVNLRRIHKNVAKEIRNADLLDVRGARNYEMMQRVSKKAFFGFMVARRISEAVTGLPQSKNSFFYHYQEPNTCSFKSDWEKKCF